MPATAIAFAANSPALGSVFNQAANQGLTVDDNADAGTDRPTTNGASTNSSSASTNHTPIFTIQGQRG